MLKHLLFNQPPVVPFLVETRVNSNGSHLLDLYTWFPCAIACPLQILKGMFLGRFIAAGTDRNLLSTRLPLGASSAGSAGVKYDDLWQPLSRVWATQQPELLC